MRQRRSPESGVMVGPKCPGWVSKCGSVRLWVSLVLALMTLNWTTKGTPWPSWHTPQGKKNNTLACKKLQDAQGCPWTCSPAHQWATDSSLQFYGAIRPRTSLSKHLQRCLGGNDHSDHSTLFQRTHRFLFAGYKFTRCHSFRVAFCIWNPCP